MAQDVLSGDLFLEEELGGDDGGAVGLGGWIDPGSGGR